MFLCLVNPPVESIEIKVIVAATGIWLPKIPLTVPGEDVTKQGVVD